MKTSYEDLQEELSELYFHYLERQEQLRGEATDHVWDTHTCTHVSESANKQAWAWYTEERVKLILKSGWACEDLDAAEDAERSSYYAALDAMPEGDYTSVEIIHDPEPEPEEEPVDPNEVETCSSCKALKLVDERCMNCEDLREGQGA